MCDAPLGFVQTERPGAYWNYDEMISPREIKKGETSKGGTIQTVSKYMGHSNSTVTLRVYSHFVPDTQSKAINVLNKITE